MNKADKIYNCLGSLEEIIKQAKPVSQASKPPTG